MKMIKMKLALLSICLTLVSNTALACEEYVLLNDGNQVVNVFNIEEMEWLERTQETQIIIISDYNSLVFDKRRPAEILEQINKACKGE